MDVVYEIIVVLVLLCYLNLYLAMDVVHEILVLCYLTQSVVILLLYSTGA